MASKGTWTVERMAREGSCRVVRRVADRESAVGWIADRTGYAGAAVERFLREDGWVREGEYGGDGALLRVVDEGAQS